MKTLRTFGMALLCVGLGAAVLAAPGSAAAGVVRKTYDFDHLATGYIDGRDNWVASPYLRVATDPMGGAPDPGSGNCLTAYGGTETHYGTRTNDANWGFDLSAVSQFTIGNSMVTDYIISGYYGRGEYLIKNSATGRSIGFGIKVLPWYYFPYIQDALGVETTGGHPRPTARNEIWDFKLDVDTAAHGGEGAGSLFAKQRGVHTEWQPVDGLQGLNLSLATAGADILAADQIGAQIQIRLVAMDDLWVEYIPEPASLSLLGIGAVALLRRKRRAAGKRRG